MPKTVKPSPGIAPERITLAQLIEKLGDPDVPVEDLKPYLEISDSKRHNGLAPILRPNTSLVDTEGPEHAAARARGDIGLGFLNGVYRTRRRVLFETTRAQRPGTPILLAEGDSWFEYPIFLKDVVDYLIDDHGYNVFCLSSAGAELKTMLRTEEYASYLKYLIKEGLTVKAFLLSAGGNDVVGPELAKVLVNFRPGTVAANLFNQDRLAATVARIEKGYRTIVADVHTVVPNLPILIHGYDYGDPRSAQGFHVPPLDGWLGEPMRGLGIPDGPIQRGVVKILMDTMNGMMSALAQVNGGLPHVHYVDNRNAVGTHWHDELHPDDAGFGTVCKRFQHVLSNL
ncbi:hypothetical protein [Mesorhizobium sp. M0296]|uniref:hypothetical protein n=1 Tax=Mesorhizobium sp. M0296 TaxID=2956931 RepID=UPI00333AB3A7